ncbi:MAG: rhodanese-like domain-containing protein [Chloroflexi bacterium]|nr:rhodanese-like domain-containing protein [Chloroflexota bacterium]
MIHPTTSSATAGVRRAGLLAGLLAVLALAAAACGSGGAVATTAPVASAPVAGAPAALAAEVSVDEASQLRDAGAFMLDVREPDEWAAGHIEGATLIPLGELASRVAEVPADRQVVVVCRSGNRSAQGRDVLLGAGLPSVTSMAGGMNDWSGSGKPVVTGQ